MQIDALSIGYGVQGGTLHALRDVSLTVRADEVLGIMGESGCGKSTLAAAMINLLAASARVTSGAVRYRGRDILTLPAGEQRRLRGRHIAMVFQDPMTAFNPVLTIGQQLFDYQHNSITTDDRKSRALAMLESAGIADAARCLRLYPHELSGGMRQRAAIAAALTMQPDVLIADEPTTALDVTMEAQVIHLLRALQTDFQGAIVVVTHHLGVIAELCDRVAVMYAGEVVEEGAVDDIFHAPRHPYTAALIACDPATLVAGSGPLPTIGGRLPDLRAPPVACAFAPRCTHATEVCRNTAPPRVTLPNGQSVLCHLVTA